MKKLWKAGMPSLMELDSLEQNVKVAQQLGLSFVELNLDVPIYLPERLPASMLKEAGEDTGLFFTVHAPENVELASPHPAIRRGNLERMREILAWAGEAGVGLVNMHLHPGVAFTLPEGKAWVGEKYEEEFLVLLWKSFEQVYGWSREYGVAVSVENTMNFHLPFVQKALGMLSRFKHFQLTWDVGHDARSGHRDRAVMLEHVSRVRHLHVHDTNGKSDHLALGTGGEVDLAAVLAFVRERDLTFVVETKTAEALRESCRWLEQAR